MRIFILFDTSFCQGLDTPGLTQTSSRLSKHSQHSQHSQRSRHSLQSALEVSVDGEPYEVISLPSLRTLEDISLSAKCDQLLFFTASLTENDVCFLLRLLRCSAIPLIVNAAHWEDEGLARLLECGRVTFVPEELDHQRVLSIIQLSRLRFSLATMQVNKVLALESSLKTQKLLAKTKAELQRHGLSESEAHKTLQRQAMDKGISIEKLLYQLS